MALKTKPIHNVPEGWWNEVKLWAQMRVAMGEVKNLREHLIDVIHKDLAKNSGLKVGDKPE